MLNQQSVDDLINFIKLNGNGIWKQTGPDYYRIFCPYCDTSRSNNYTDYHGNLMLKELVFKCWKCDTGKSLLRFLLEQNYSNQEVINELNALTKNNYIRRTIHVNTRSNYDNDLSSRLMSNYLNFRKRYPDKFDKYLNYIKYRCGDINPIKYGFNPLIKDEKLAVEFYNSSGYPITARFIDDSNIRYIKYKNGGYYYYQSIKDIVEETTTITICEGIFDCVNLSNYYIDFKSNLFFAMNSRKYNSCFKYLISKYFLLGHYNFNIVFDNDAAINVENEKAKLFEIKNQYNSKCKLNFYMPMYTKDVSELMLIKRT